MKLTPPYPDYKFFRKPYGESSTVQLLIDLSILAYSDKSFVRSTLLNTPLVLNEFISVGQTQVLIISSPALTYTVAFRGTETFDIRDWKIDFDCRVSGTCHRGFLEAYEDVARRIDKWTKDAASVYYTGHSLGGALATVAYVRGLHRQASCITFGAPKVFTQTVNRDMDVTRYVHGCDIVPRLPPLPFVHVGHAVELKQTPRPWSNIFTPLRIFSHVPTLYAERVWGAPGSRMTERTGDA